MTQTYFGNLQKFCYSTTKEKDRQIDQRSVVTDFTLTLVERCDSCHYVLIF